MISAGELKKGSVIRQGNDVFLITEYQRVKPLDSGVFIKTKLKNILTSEDTERIFRPDDPVMQEPVDHITLLYQNNTEDSYQFLTEETGEPFSLSHDLVGNALQYIKKNESVKITSCNGVVLSMELPPFTILKVIGLFPDPSGSSALLAAVETGAKVRVPSYVEMGDSIKIDSRSGKFLARV